MNLDDEADPAPEDDTAEATVPEEPEASEPEQQFDDDGNPIEEPPEDEEVELDDDIRVRVPKDQAQKVREALLRQADYSRKTADLAEQRKALEAERQVVRETTEVTKEELNAFATASAIGQRLGEYQKVDWAGWLQQANAAYDEDLKAHINAEYMRFQQLKDQQQQALGNLANLREQRISNAQREAARRIEEGRATLTREISGWNDDLRAKLIGFAGEFGFTSEELDDLEADPRVAKVLHAAFEGRASKRAASKLANLANDQKARPAKTLRGTSGGPVKADTKDFAAFERMAAKATG